MHFSHLGWRPPRASPHTRAAHMRREQSPHLREMRKHCTCAPRLRGAIARNRCAVAAYTTRACNPHARHMRVSAACAPCGACAPRERLQKSAPTHTRAARARARGPRAKRAPPHEARDMRARARARQRAPGALKWTGCLSLPLARQPVRPPWAIISIIIVDEKQETRCEQWSLPQNVDIHHGPWAWTTFIGSSPSEHHTMGHHPEQSSGRSPCIIKCVIVLMSRHQRT